MTATEGITSLGCFDIVFSHLGLRTDKARLVQVFGRRWGRSALLAFFRRHGWYQVEDGLRDGDVVLIGLHPGVVTGGYVQHLHRGHVVLVPARRLRPEVVLRRLRCRR